MELRVDMGDELRAQLQKHCIRIDTSKFAQVIRNLISNGLKFTPAGGSVTVTVEILQKPQALFRRGVHPREGAKEVNTIKISVTDTGHGISEVGTPLDRINY